MDYHPSTTMLSYSGGLERMVQNKPYSYQDCLNMSLKNTYTNMKSVVHNRQVYIWRHTLRKIITALVKMGVYVEFLYGFPFVDYERFYGAMVKGDVDGNSKVACPKHRYYSH